MTTIELNREEFNRKYQLLEQPKNAQRRMVLLQWLEGKSEEQIANIISKSTSIVRRNISEASKHFLGATNSPTRQRKRLVELFYKYKAKLVAHEVLQRYDLLLDSLPKPLLPDGPEPLDSPFYLERPFELTCYERILEDDCLIRIKAANQMGKTSLMIRIFDKAEQNGYLTVELNLLDTDGYVLSNYNNFCLWFCSHVSKQLDIENKLADYWMEYNGPNSNCTSYFEDYILPQFISPVVLALDEFDRLFSYPEIYHSFSGMLRSWYQKSKTNDIWKKLRLIVTYSTEYHVTLNIDQSPLNVGYIVELPEFTKEQIEQLATLHRLNFNDTQIEELIGMVGGHPYLLRLAMYHIIRQDTTLEDVLQNATTNEGIYSYYLLRILEDIKKDSQLVTEFRKVFNTDTYVELYPKYSNKLYSIGLVHKKGDQVKLRCNLYRQYFSKFL